MAINAAELQITVTADASQAKSELSGVEGMLSGVLIGHQVKDFGEGIMDFVSDFVMVGAVFEEQMTVIDRIIGGTVSHLEELKKKAVEADINTMFDPFEVAKGMEMIARSGFDALQIIGTPGQQDGLIDSLLFFAAATRTDIESAGRSFSATMRIFEKSGMTSIEIADLLTAAILRSGRTTDQFMTAFQYVGAISQQFGTAPAEIATAVALLEQLGIRSMSVGTGLRSFYDGIASGRGDIEALGISLYTVDNAGNEVLRTIPDIIGQFNALSKTMSAGDFQNLVADIFGKPASSPLTTLFTTGADNWDRFVEDMEEVGSAEEMMEARMNTLMGSIEKLKATWLGFKKVLGDSVSEYIKPVVDGLTAFVNAMQSLPAPILKVMAGLITLVGVFSMLAGAMIIFKAVGGGAAIAAVFSTVGAALLPIIAIVGALALAFVAIKTNFGGVRDALVDLGGHISDFVANFEDVYSFISKDRGPLEAFIRTIGGGLAKELGLSGDKMTKFYDSVKRVADKAIDFDRGLGFISRGIRGISDAFKEGGLSAGFEELFGRGGERILNGIGKILGTLPDVLGQLLVELDWGPTLDPMMAEIGRMSQRFGNAVEAAFAGDWSRAWENVKRGAHRGARAGVLLWGVLVKIGNWAIEFGQELWPKIKEKFNLLFGGNDFVSGQGPDGGFNNSGQFITINSLAVKVKDFAVSAWRGSLAEGLFDQIWRLLTEDNLFDGADITKSEEIGNNIGSFVGEWLAKGLKKALEFAAGFLFKNDADTGAVARAGSVLKEKNEFDVGDLLSSFLEGFFAGFDEAGDEVFEPWRIKIRAWWTDKWNSLLDFFANPRQQYPGAAGTFGGATTANREFSLTSILKGFLNFDDWMIEELGLPDFGGQFRNWLDRELSDIAEVFAGNPTVIALGRLMNGDFAGAYKAMTGQDVGTAVPNTMHEEPLSWDSSEWWHGTPSDWQWYQIEQYYLRQEELKRQREKFIRENPPPPGVPGGVPMPGFEEPWKAPKVSPIYGPPAPSSDTVAQRFIPAISGGTAQAGTILKTFVENQAPAIMTPLATVMQSKAQQGMTSFTTGITTGMNTAVQFAVIGRNRIIAAVQLPSMYHHGFVTGQSLGSGLAAGIISTLQQVINARNQLINAGTSGAAPAPTPPRGPGFLPISGNGTVIQQTNNIQMSASEVEEFVNATRFVSNLDRSRQIVLGTV